MFGVILTTQNWVLMVRRLISSAIILCCSILTKKNVRPNAVTCSVGSKCSSVCKSQYSRFDALFSDRYSVTTSNMYCISVLLQYDMFFPMLFIINKSFDRTKSKYQKYFMGQILYISVNSSFREIMEHNLSNFFEKKTHFSTLIFVITQFKNAEIMVYK